MFCNIQIIGLRSDELIFFIIVLPGAIIQTQSSHYYGNNKILGGVKEEEGFLRVHLECEFYFYLMYFFLPQVAITLPFQGLPGSSLI